jgi:pimeloyl-ACP methyl ester carboxylesterase
MYIDQFAKVNNIQLHYIEYENDKPKLLLLHGLTANAHCFAGLIQAGLTDHFSIISVDQRGRGLSSKACASFSIEEHALDIIGLLDFLQIEKIHIAGHSFGGLMASYLAFQYPERFDRVIMLDAAPEMNPRTPEMLASTLGRLDKNFTSFDAYLEGIKAAPFMTFWDEAMLAYYQADVTMHDDGSVSTRSSLLDIIEVAKAVAKQDWKTCFSQMAQSSLMVVALDHYALGEPLLPVNKAKEAISLMQDCGYTEVSGNHQTMLYGKGASQIVQEIIRFLST